MARRRIGARSALATVLALGLALAPATLAAPTGVEGRAVAVLVATHADYTFEMEGAPTVYRAVTKGEAQLVAGLGPKDVATVWHYDEVGAWRVTEWPAAGEVVSKLAKLAPREREGFPTAPRLYAAIDKVLANIADRGDALPADRMILLVSDGKDVGLGDRAALTKTLDALAARAKALGVRLVVLGLTLDIEEPLGPLAELAKRTGGSYVQTTAIDSDRTITDAVVAWGAAALKQVPREK